MQHTLYLHFLPFPLIEILSSFCLLKSPETLPAGSCSGFFGVGCFPGHCN